MRLHLGDVDDANGSELVLEIVGGNVVLSVRCPESTSGTILSPHECRTLAHSLLQVAEQTKETVEYMRSEALERVVTPSPADKCPCCGQTRAEIERDQCHAMLTDVVCPEACTCIPECFSMAEHHERELVEGLASAIEDVAYARGLDSEEAQKKLRARLIRWVSR